MLGLSVLDIDLSLDGLAYRKFGFLAVWKKMRRAGFRGGSLS